MLKTALLIDGGHLRVCAKRAGKTYDNSFIEVFSHTCFSQDEYKFRIFYYDSPQYRGTVKLPVSGGDTTFQSNDRWLNDLAKLRSEERRVGKEWVRTCKSRWSP